MRTTLIPHNTFSRFSEPSVAQTRAKLVDAQRELSSGRWSDVGYKLGSRNGFVVDIRAQLGFVDALLNTNVVVETRADATQIALENMVKETESLFEATTAARSDQVSADLVKNIATEGSKAIASSINTSVDGVYVFSGINSETPPVKDYFGVPKPASRQAVDAAFLAEFGFAQTDPAVSTISAAAMESFIDNAFSNLFDDPAWATNWSSASDDLMKTRISFSETLETSQSANRSVIRKLVMAYTMVADLGIDGLSKPAFEKTMERASQMTREVVDGLNNVRADVGVAQQRVQAAQDKLGLQQDMFERMVGKFENVDPYEAATKVSNLSTQLETAYTLTARLERLSLVNFL